MCFLLEYGLLGLVSRRYHELLERLVAVHVERAGVIYKPHLPWLVCHAQRLVHALEAATTAELTSFGGFRSSHTRVQRARITTHYRHWLWIARLPWSARSRLLPGACFLSLTCCSGGLSLCPAQHDDTGTRQPVPPPSLSGQRISRGFTVGIGIYLRSHHARTIAW